MKPAGRFLDAGQTSVLLAALEPCVMMGSLLPDTFGAAFFSFFLEYTNKIRRMTTRMKRSSPTRTPTVITRSPSLPCLASSCGTTPSAKISPPALVRWRL